MACLGNILSISNSLPSWSTGFDKESEANRAVVAYGFQEPPIKVDNLVEIRIVSLPLTIDAQDEFVFYWCIKYNRSTFTVTGFGMLGVYSSGIGCWFSVQDAAVRESLKFSCDQKGNAFSFVIDYGTRTNNPLCTHWWITLLVSRCSTNQVQWSITLMLKLKAFVVRLVEKGI
ncbi:hypothetical protein NPIL_582901 [Nephila pilipes]|uniref:Uncharacterized protein n=1 Tax=Nephila pilipes TaxID=299642 RepID=A0A8X6TZ64_NEPPI|nr:hypothetical protein NPIL_582901 [Nephila pilipes]